MPTGSGVYIKTGYYIYLDTHGSSGNWELYLIKESGTGIYGGSFDSCTVSLSGKDVNTGSYHNVNCWSGSSNSVDMRSTTSLVLASGNDSWLSNSSYSYTMSASLGADSAWGTSAATCYVVRSVDPPSSYTHTLSYDANGGTGAPSSQTITNTSSSSFSATVSTTQPTWTNHIFTGWALNNSATVATHSGGSSYSFSTTNATLYAVWQHYTHTINYKANGGSGAPSATTVTNMDSSSFTATLSSDQPTRTGYTFLGWSDSSTATSPTYYGGVQYAFAGTSVDLYAVWNELTYSVTYMGNDATGGTQDSSSRKYSESLTLPTTTNYYKYGNTFMGWYDSASGGNKITSIAAGTSQDKVVYAYWSEGDFRLKNNNNWVICKCYVKGNDVWKQGRVYVKSNGVWKPLTK